MQFFYDSWDFLMVSPPKFVQILMYFVWNPEGYPLGFYHILIHFGLFLYSTVMCFDGNLLYLVRHCYEAGMGSSRPPCRGETKFDQNVGESDTGTSRCTLTTSGADQLIIWKIAKADSTLRSSRAVPHPSTDRALRRLTSEVRRDPVHSTRYGRQRIWCFASGLLLTSPGLRCDGAFLTPTLNGYSKAGTHALI